MTAQTEPLGMLGADDEALGMLREVEVAWLAEKLGLTIANLGYPVGCGIEPKQEWLERCAGVLFDRYLKMIRMAHEAASANHAT